MIQDIAPHVYHNEYKPVTPDGNSIILAYENGKCFFHRKDDDVSISCLLYTSPSPRDGLLARMPSSA